MCTSQSPFPLCHFGFIGNEMMAVKTMKRVVICSWSLLLLNRSKKKDEKLAFFLSVLFYTWQSLFHFLALAIGHFISDRPEGEPKVLGVPRFHQNQIKGDIKTGKPDRAETMGWGNGTKREAGAETRHVNLLKWWRSRIRLVECYEDNANPVWCLQFRSPL